ncbi:MAG: Rrf2 family transcriptional regulator [Parvibaculum sp.]|uniref:Rrf2 family transcriptional regulator n=1 Tax=Parvibaculum sp. TaxID=2024848 RepID=UPI0025D81FF3|nr:Rrf2 family transcriptional regulator [Parvibaculum sp.]MCE9651229.1 Rrf2 family transcriptional regulator [Parvibaculum sp.]
MRLTLYTDYSLRLLTYVALKGDRLTTIQEIAEAYDISHNHLMKVVTELGRAGIIETVRGRGGGLRLARKPEEINIGALARRMEDDGQHVECFQAATNTCRITPSCKLKHKLREALEAYYAVLDGTTLADLVEKPQPLRRLLAIPA